MRRETIIQWKINHFKVNNQTTYSVMFTLAPNFTFAPSVHFMYSYLDLHHEDHLMQITFENKISLLEFTYIQLFKISTILISAYLSYIHFYVGAIYFVEPIQFNCYVTTNFFYNPNFEFRPLILGARTVFTGSSTL